MHGPQPVGLHSSAALHDSISVHSLRVALQYSRRAPLQRRAPAWGQTVQVFAVLSHWLAVGQARSVFQTPSFVHWSKNSRLHVHSPGRQLPVIGEMSGSPPGTTS